MRISNLSLWLFSACLVVLDYTRKLLTFLGGEESAWETCTISSFTEQSNPLSLKEWTFGAFMMLFPDVYFSWHYPPGPEEPMPRCRSSCVRALGTSLIPLRDCFTDHLDAMAPRFSLGILFYKQGDHLGHLSWLCSFRLRSRLLFGKGYPQHRPDNICTTRVLLSCTTSYPRQPPHRPGGPPDASLQVRSL